MKLTIQFLKKIYDQFFDQHISQLSASLAYTTLVTIVPILIILFYVSDASLIISKAFHSSVPIIAKNYLPGIEINLILKYLSDFTSTATEFSWLSILIIFFITLLLCNEIEGAFTHIFNSKSRAIFPRFLTYAILIIIGPALFACVISLFLYTTTLSTGLIPKLNTLELLINYGITKGSMVLLFFLLYKFLPNTKINNIYALKTSALITLTLIGLQYLFEFYLQKIHTYSTMYGALYIIPVLLLWLYLVWCIILIGALILNYFNNSNN